MKASRVFILFVLCLLALIQTGCGGGNSSTVSDVTVPDNEVVNGGDSNPVIVDGGGSNPVIINLTSVATGPAIPFTTAIGFKKGDVSGTPVLDLDYFQVDIKKRWNDGSIKHAIFSGVYDSIAGTPTKVTVSDGDIISAGFDLTEADIVAAAPVASVELGGYGSVNLADLLGSPDRIWLQGPEVIEAHYVTDVNTDPALGVKFHVRLYAGGEMRVRVIVENGTLGGVNETKRYSPNVIVGGETIYDNGGSTLEHYAHTRWSVTGWIGISDPQITVAHDTDYMEDTRLVPNYWKHGPSNATLDGLYQSYSPLEQGNWTKNMGDTGFQAQIGLLPKWDALYINSSGDSRAFKSVLANAKALNSYPIIWADSTTNEPIVISDWGTWTFQGAAGGGATSLGAGSLTWDVAHHPSGGYLAYLITGDYYFLETMKYQATTIYLVTSSLRGSGTSRRILPVQTRGVAWANRTIGQVVGISPLDSIVTDLQSMLANDANEWLSTVQSPGVNGLGYIYSYELPSGAYGTGAASPWQQHFWVQSLGHVSDLEPLSNMSSFDLVKNHLYKSAVGILGGDGVDNYCFTEASRYTVKISATNDSEPATWYDSWGTVFSETTGAANTNCGNTLEGGSGGTPNTAATGYWGNLLPAIAYAVEDGAPGAADSWARLTGATNFGDLENSGFDDVPVWGIVPRGLD